MDTTWLSRAEKRHITRSHSFLSLVLFSLFEPNEDRKGCKDSSLFSLFLIFFCVSCVLCISEKQPVSSDSSMEITSGNYIPVQRLEPNVTLLLAGAPQHLCPESFSCSQHLFHQPKQAQFSQPILYVSKAQGSYLISHLLLQKSHFEVRHSTPIHSVCNSASSTNLGARSIRKATSKCARWDQSCVSTLRETQLTKRLWG